MQQARRDRLAAAKVGFDMGIPFNELNRLFDLGFPSFPWGDTGYLPRNLQKTNDFPPSQPPKNALNLSSFAHHQIENLKS
jgi:hypothetical protein